MKLSILIIIFLVLIFLDKGITVANVKQTWNNFPDAVKEDPFLIEKNPMAKWSFEKFGLYNGSFVMGVISLATLLLAFSILNFAFKSQLIALYILMIAYGLVITNNLYFLLKYSKMFI